MKTSSLLSFPDEKSSLMRSPCACARIPAVQLLNQRTDFHEILCERYATECHTIHKFNFLGTGWTIGVLGFDSPRGLGIFLLPHRVQNGSGAHPASYPMGIRSYLPGSKATGT